MVVKLALFYNDLLHTYVLNEHGRMGSSPHGREYQEDRDSEELPLELKDYLKKTYGQRKTELTLDAYCRGVHSSELEETLRDSKITLK